MTDANEGEDREPYWHAQLAAAVILGLSLTLPERLTLGPSWVLPVLAGVLLVGLALTTPYRRHDESTPRRALAIGLVALVTVGNAGSLALLVDSLVTGTHLRASELLHFGGVVWANNIAVFALWFWELDRGGPARRLRNDEDAPPDFLFPQMTSPDLAPKGWAPLFVDYLYVAFTNATAFSPTDAMPLSRRSKALMLVQAVASLVTVALILARAVNVLK